jgi:hypothetical protein
MTGRVNFDERGNAVWEWAIRTGKFDRNASTQRVKVLTEAPTGLALREMVEAESRRVIAKRNLQGINPYQPSAQTPKTPGADHGFNPYEHSPTPRTADVIDFPIDLPGSRRTR